MIDIKKGYKHKQTEVGVITGDWAMKKLGEVLIEVAELEAKV